MKDINEIHELLDNHNKEKKHKTSRLKYLLIFLGCFIVGSVLVGFFFFGFFRGKQKDDVDTGVIGNVDRNLSDIGGSNIRIVDTGPFIHHYAPSNSFGMTHFSDLNESFFENWTSNYFNVSLKASPDNISWYDADEGLTQFWNWTHDSNGSRAKISWIVNTSDAPAPLFYKLITGIDARARRFINGTDKDNFTVSFDVPVGNDTYSLFLNYSDVIPLIQDGKVWVRRGLKTVDNVSYFYWILQSVNKIPVGVVFEIDPIFGNTAIGTSKHDGDEIPGGYFRCSVSCVADNITAYVDTTGAKVGRCGIYDSNKKLLGYTDEVTVSSDGWWVFPFSINISVIEGNWYYLVLFSSSDKLDLYYQDLGGNGLFSDTGESYPTFPNPYSATIVDADANPCIYCSHHENATIGEDYTFGDTSNGDSNQNIENTITGTLITFTDEDGIADKITARIYTEGSFPFKIKCAIYDNSTGNVITNGETEERIFDSPLTVDWYDFDFPVNPTLVKNTEYIVTIYANSSASSCFIRRNTSATGINSTGDYHTYNGFHEPYDYDQGYFQDRAYCMYVTWHNYSHILDNWLYWKEITINHSYVDGNLTNFPILFHNTSSDFANHCRPDAYDVCFFNETNETKYNHEIEYYDNTTGELITWINVTNLTDDVDTVLHMFYGNGTTGTQENVADTWDSNFVGVWHMQSSYNGSGIDDSTTNNDNWYMEKINTPTQVEGKIGYAQAFGGDADNDYFIRNSESDDWCVNTTISIWCNVNSTANGAYKAMIARDYIYGDMWWGLQYNTMYTFHGGNGTYQSKNYYGGLTAGNWGLRTIVRDNSSMYYHYYLDGGFWVSKSYNIWVYEEHASGSYDDLIIGSGTDTPSQQWNGSLDEIRISNIVRDASWIATEYNTSAYPSSFISVGSEQEISEEELTWQSIVLINGTGFNVTVFQPIDYNVNGSGYNLSWYEWQSIDYMVNGTGYNNTVWQPVHFSINGTGFNQTAWQMINYSINGTGYNLTVWQPIDFSINGTGFNLTQYQVIDYSINGTGYNISIGINWQPINYTINGTGFNITQYQMIDYMINGTGYNSTQYHPIILINGTGWNVTQYSPVDYSINGTGFNTSIGINWQLIVLINGTGFNITQFSPIILINGTGWNSTQYSPIDFSINGTGFNSSFYFHDINHTINGTGFNVSLPAIMVISNVFPGNSSTGINLQPMMYCTINHTNGDNMNISWFYGSSLDSCNTLLGGADGQSNSTQTELHYNASSYVTGYFFRIQLEDGVNWLNESFSFTTKPQGGGYVVSSNAIVGIALCGLLGLFLVFIFYIRRRRD